MHIANADIGPESTTPNQAVLVVGIADEQPTEQAAVPDKVRTKALTKKEEEDTCAISDAHIKNKCSYRVFLRWLLPGLAGLLVFSMTAGIYIRKAYLEAETVLRTGPKEAYALEADGKAKAAQQLWAQINAKAFWYHPLAIFSASIDKPWLQKTALAFKAQDWKAVAEYGFRALQVPITDEQALDVQGMILQATARLVRAYMPNQQDQPLKGGIPEHAAPICEFTGNVWLIPVILALVAAVALYGKMLVLFMVSILLIPGYVYMASIYGEKAVASCEARLVFNPKKINLYAGFTQQAPDKD